MGTVRQWLRRLRAMLLRSRTEADMDEEMRAHVAYETEHLMRTGSLTPAEARRRALVSFGGMERTRERARDVRFVRWLQDGVQDTRLGIRSMARVPGFTLVAVLTLALGIGATTAMFSVVRGVLLDPLPYPESDRLVSVWSRFLPESGFDFPQFPLSPPEYLDYRAATTALEDVAAFRSFRATISAGGGDASSIRAAAATAHTFDVLRVAPALGRTFAVAEDVPEGPAVAILGHALWRRAYGGDPAVLGRTIRVNGIATEIIGVMPAGFAWPSPETELWTPLGLDAAQDNRGSHFLAAVGRLAHGADLALARTELSALMQQWEAEYPDMHRGHFLFLTPLLDDTVGAARPALLVLLGAVGFVLLIVCANVANLLLTRGEERRRELAVRNALGAGTPRLVRQFIAEGAVLSVAGAAGGVALAHVLIDVTLALGADSIPRADNVGVDARVLLFVGAIALFTTMIFALAPLSRLRAAAPRLVSGDAGRSTTSAPRVQLRQLLVTFQIALAVVVVTGAGLMLRSFTELTRVDPGFSSGDALVADLSLPAGDYQTAESVVAFYERLLERLESLPGARSAAAATSLPLGNGAPNHDFRIEGAPPAAPGEPARSGDFIIADHRYAQTLGIDILAGRFFEASDRLGTVPVVVVNRTLARMFWPDENPIGRRIRDSSEEGPWLEVVGVIDDVQYRSPDADMRPAWYVPLPQMALSVPSGARTFSVTVRATGAAAPLAQPMRDVLRAVDAGLPIIRMRSLERVVADSVAPYRFVLTVLTLFALLALALGAIGVYGVLGYTVARRTREFGIRIALGAGHVELAALVLAGGVRMALIGSALGIVGALAATRLIQGLLFRVSPTDPVTFVAVGAIMCGVALTASIVPLLRVLRADPVRALRTE